VIRNPDDTSEAQTQCTAPQWGRRFRQLRLLPSAHAMHGYNCEQWEGEWSARVRVQGMDAECDRECVLDCGCNSPSQIPMPTEQGSPRHDKLGMLQRLKESSRVVALEKTAVNLPEINDERSGAQARARLGASAVPSLSGFEQATDAREQAAASLQTDGWKCRAMSDRTWTWTENLVVATTAPRHCGTVSRRFDLVWYASPFALGRSLLPSVCCA
jgi:hypothetical protein